MTIKQSLRRWSITGAAMALVLVSLPTSPAAAYDSQMAGRPSTWSLQPVPSPALAPSGVLTAVSCPSVPMCIAVGNSHDATSVDVTLAERWDGVHWRIQPTPNPAGANNSFLAGVSCRSAIDCIAVGNYVDPSGRQVTLAEHWNGQGWQIQPTPNPEGGPDSFLLSVSCTTPTACIAVGYSRLGAGMRQTLAERWNGADWNLLSTPSAGDTTDSTLTSVSCAGAAACTAVGYSGSFFFSALPLAERWNGSSWSLEAPPNAPGGTFGLPFLPVSCATAASASRSGVTPATKKPVGRWPKSGPSAAGPSSRQPAIGPRPWHPCRARQPATAPRSACLSNLAYWSSAGTGRAGRSTPRPNRRSASGPPSSRCHAPAWARAWASVT